MSLMSFYGRDVLDIGYFDVHNKSCFSHLLLILVDFCGVANAGNSWL